jgi:branched-chain amino acid transport system ATP-binding protein
MQPSLEQASAADAALDVSDLSVAYGGIKAVRRISFHVDPGELVCLIGSNGAGKSTTLRALTALVPRQRGSVRLHGEDTGDLPTHELARRGLVMVPEGRGVFARLSVRENLLLGAYTQDRTGRRSEKELERVLDLLPKLKERFGQLAGTMSGGEQQMVAIGRALMSKPRVLLLDEPSMGLSPIMVETIFGVIKAVSRTGVTILLVEQNARLALEISSRAYVMDSGVLTLEGQSQWVLEDPRVRDAYLGEVEATS